MKQFQVISHIHNGAVGKLVAIYPWEFLPDVESLLVLEFVDHKREVFRAKELMPTEIPLTQLNVRSRCEIGYYVTVTCVSCGKESLKDKHQRTSRSYSCIRCASAASTKLRASARAECRRERAKGETSQAKKCTFGPEALLAQYATMSLEKLARKLHTDRSRVRQWIIETGGTIRRSTKG